MNPDLRSSAAHVFVGSLDAPVPDDEDAHHLFRVLRLRDGESVTASDGAGRWRRCVVNAGSLEPIGTVVVDTAAPGGAIAAAIPKGDRLDWMVQKLTEVGVQRLVLLEAERSVVRWDPARADRQRGRLTRIAALAAAQSRRTRLPVVEGPVALDALLAEPGASLADPDAAPLVGPVAGPVLIGPEGGWSPGEMQRAADAGAGRVSLGRTVLRVETAAVVAAVLATSRRGE